MSNKIKKIIYIANVRMPSRRANAIQIINTCFAISRKGIDLELLVPKRKSDITEDSFQYFNIDKAFKIKHLNIFFDFIKFGRIGYMINSLVFSMMVFFYILGKKESIIYSRNRLPLLFSALLGKKTFYESHRPESNFMSLFIINRVNGLVCITKNLKSFYVNNGIDADKIEVSYDATNIDLFRHLPAQEKGRELLNFPQSKKIAMYVGSFDLYSWKGVDVFLDAARLLPEVIFVGIGAKKEMAIKVKEKYGNNVMLVESKPNYVIPSYLNCANVLVLPNKSGNEISEKYTSPMKLFEYMASGKVIVASELPSIKEILDDKNAILVEPNSSMELSRGIQLALKPESLIRGVNAKTDVVQYSWNNRAKGIIKFIESCVE